MQRSTPPPPSHPLNPSSSPAQPLRLAELAALAVVRAAGGAAGLLELGRATEEALAALRLDAAAAAAVAAAWPAAVQVGALSRPLFVVLLLNMAPSPVFSSPALFPLVIKTFS
jgi:hypothetical protein